MSPTTYVRTFVGPFAAAAALTLAAVPALAKEAMTPADCSAIKVELANPAPGARVEVGNFVLQGIAQDTRATQSQGFGIDHIDFFLDSRELGGMNLGTAVPGMVSGPFGPASFQTTLSVPNEVGGHDLFAYAYSSVTGQVETISVPIVVGEDPSKVSEPTTLSQSMTCGGGSTATPTTTPSTAMTQPTTPTTTAPTTGTTVVAPTTGSSTTSSTMTLEVANPSPGDTVKVGAFMISGDAMDRAASSGSGIDRIDVFLDNRDSGGMFLGSAQLGPTSFWQATVTLPSNQTGLHELWFYAHSSATGATTSVSVPVAIAK